MIATDATQMLIDGFGALGAGAVTVVLLNRRGRTTVQTVLMLVFGLAALFYLFRALAAATGIEAFGLASLVLACTLPLGALLLTENLLRRHAPLPIKLLIGGGAVVGLVAAALAGSGMERAFSLALYVPAALLLVLGLILFRDRSGLSPMENASLDSYGRALAAAGLLTLTDFGLGLPVGLSALGMLGLAYAAASGASAPRRWYETLKELTLASVTAVLLAAALLYLDPPASFAEAAGLLAVTASALLTLSVLLRLQSGGNDQQRRLFDQALVEADTADLPRFIDAASRAAPLRGLVLVEASDLANFEAPVLLRAFEAGAVVSLAQLSRTPTDNDPAEQMTALLRQHASTHAILISDAPPRIALVALGASTQPEDDERAMALFQKMAGLIARRGPETAA